MFDVMRIAAVLTVCAAAGCGHGSGSASAAVEADLRVYKTPTCGCCQSWVDHVAAAGFAADVVTREDLGALKAQYGIENRYQSCHTAVSAEGHVFEGHVPAKLIRQFLRETPAGAIGLSVPGMPVGSPGMEYGEQFMPYEVLLLKADGTSEVYAEMDTREAQF